MFSSAHVYSLCCAHLKNLGCLHTAPTLVNHYHVYTNFKNIVKFSVWLMFFYYFASASIQNAIDLFSLYRMVSIDNPPRYANQLLFNLDASGASSLQNGFKSPECIVIEKIVKKPERPVFPTNNVFVPIKSDKLSLAIQLAKLDVSNSNFEKASKSNLKIPAKKAANEGDAKYVREAVVGIPRQSNAVVHKCKTLQKPHRIAPKQQQKSRPPKKQIHFQDPPAFDDHIRQIVQPVHSSKRVPAFSFSRVKDAATSTADINREVRSFANQSDFKQFAGRLQAVVKKEKLRRRRNDRLPHRSGFLSLYRSPTRQRHRTPSPHSSPVLKSKPPPRRPAAARVNCTDVAVQTPRQPRSEKLSRKAKVLTAKKVLYDDATSDSESAEETSLLQRHRAPVQRLLRRAATEGSPSSPRRPKPGNKGVADQIFDEIIEDAADEIRAMHVDRFAGDAAHDVNNAATYETLYQRIRDLEKEEQEIRSRWHALHYDDIIHARDARPSDSSDSCVNEPSPLKIVGGLLQSPYPDQNKKPYKFVSDFAHRDPKLLTRTTQQQCESSGEAHPARSAVKPRRKIGVFDDTLKSVLGYRESRQRYLKTSFHEPKGKFNPWKIVKELSDEIVAKLMSSVCEEVNEAMEGCVDDIFEGEFADPSASALQSLADQSTISSSKYDESFVQ